MTRLIDLKEWVTVPEAAKHLSVVFSEEVTEADVLRLALDGHLRLSVYFVNYATARYGKVVRYKESELLAAIKSGNFPADLQWTTFPAKAMAALNSKLPLEMDEKQTTMLVSIRLDEDRYLSLSDDIKTLQGVWDLPLIGNELADIEHEYQSLTGGPTVNLQGLDGAFVERDDGRFCQLQESFDDNKYQAGSSAQLEELKRRISENSIEGAEAESLLLKHKEQRKEFLERKRSRPDKENYYPAGGLPSDAVIVVRTEALRALERSLSSPDRTQSTSLLESFVPQETEANANVIAFWLKKTRWTAKEFASLYCAINPVALENDFVSRLASAGTPVDEQKKAQIEQVLTLIRHRLETPEAVTNTPAGWKQKLKTLDLPLLPWMEQIETMLSQPTLRDRTTEMTRSDAWDGNRAYISDKLAILNQAAYRWWANADREDRTTHPSNKDVEAWLLEHGLSGKLAESGATTIRPEWAPTGRKPKE